MDNDSHVSTRDYTEIMLFSKLIKKSKNRTSHSQKKKTNSQKFK